MARNYRKEYDKFQDSASAIKKRTALNRMNYKKGTYGNKDGLDVSHTEDGIRLEKSSTNKGRKEKSRMKGSKRKQQGGYLKGPSHDQGGIAAIVGGQEPVELEGGEYIIKKSSAKKLGTKALNEINKKGRIPTMAKGGKTKNINEIAKQLGISAADLEKLQTKNWRKKGIMKATPMPRIKGKEPKAKAMPRPKETLKESMKAIPMAKGGEVNVKTRRPPTTPGKGLHSEDFTKGGHFYEELTDKEKKAGMKLGLSKDPDKAGRKYRKLKSKSPHRTKFQQMIAPGQADDPTLPWEKGGGLKKTRYTSKSKKAKGGKVDVNKEVREDYQVLSDDVMKNIGKRKIAGKKVYNPRTGKELKSTRDYMVFWDEQDRVKRSMMKDKRYIPEKAKGGEVKATDRQKTSNLYQGSMGDVKDRMKRNPSFAKGMEKYY